MRGVVWPCVDCCCQHLISYCWTRYAMHSYVCVWGGMPHAHAVVCICFRVRPACAAAWCKILARASMCVCVCVCVCVCDRSLPTILTRSLWHGWSDSWLSSRCDLNEYKRRHTHAQIQTHTAQVHNSSRARPHRLISCVCVCVCVCVCAGYCRGRDSRSFLPGQCG